MHAGLDEVGRGPLAGPVVVAAASFPSTPIGRGYMDSKTLTPKRRALLSLQIQEEACDWCIVALGPKTIDELNILGATKKAMILALKTMAADLMLIDGNLILETKYPYKSIVQGDQKHPEIAAASILAKVWRDRLMDRYDELFPGYGFAKHKGYPTKDHQEALTRLSPSPVHRHSFGPVRRFVSATSEQMLLFSEGDVLVLAKGGRGFDFLPEPIPLHPEWALAVP